GIDLREKPFEIVDVYASADMTFGAGRRGAGLLGAGVTIPFPLLNVRLSPAIGLHGYTNRLEDSVITHGETLFGSSYRDTSLHVIENRKVRMGIVGSFSVSAWLPQ